MRFPQNAMAAPEAAIRVHIQLSLQGTLDAQVTPAAT
jgi:hypothetical protein